MDYSSIAFFEEEYGLAAQWLERVVDAEPDDVPLGIVYKLLMRCYYKVNGTLLCIHSLKLNFDSCSV